MKQMRVGLSLVWVGILILALVFTAYPACQPARDPDEIVLYETTKVFTEEEAENVLEFTEDRDTIVFEEVTAFVADIEPGDVLVSEHPVPGAEYGFLERVIEVTDDGKAVDVEPATLEDVIEQGVIVVNQTIPKDDLMADAMWAPGVQVLQIATGYNFNFSPMTGVTIKGHLTVTADAQVDLKASFWRGLQKFEFIFSPGLEMEASLEATASVSWEKEWTLGKAKAVIPIWGPVSLNLGIELVVGTDGGIETKLETSVTYQRGYDVGFRYDKDAGWSTIKNIKGGGADVNEPTLQGKVEGRVYGGVRLSASVGVSYVLEAGLELELLGNVKGSGIVRTPTQWKWEYDFELYLTAQLAVGLDALLIGDVKYKFDPWRWPDPPEYNLAYGASGRVTTASGQALPGVTITFSDGGGPDTTDSAGYWCKHLATGPVTATPQADGYTFRPTAKTVTESESNYDFVAEEKVKYTLTTSSTEGGKVKVPGEGPYPYYEGSTATLVAEAAKNGNFTKWTSDNYNIADPHNVKMTIKMMGNYSVTAHFDLLEHYCGNCEVETPNDKKQNETCDQPPNIAGNQCPDGDYCINCTCVSLTGGSLFGPADCGDGYVEGDEECDLADKVRLDPPLPCDYIPIPCPGGQECINCTCPEEVCGDGIVTPPEECDPGDPAKGIPSKPCPEYPDEAPRTCNEECKCVPVRCGDGIVTPPEECDPGDPDQPYTAPPVPCPGGLECINCRCKSPEEVLRVGASPYCNCDFVVTGGYYAGSYDCGCGYTQYDCGCSFGTVLPQYVVCHGCIATIHLWVQDLTGGSCPIESVGLELGEPEPPLYTVYIGVPGPYGEFFKYTHVMEDYDWCGETTRFMVTARNSCGTRVEFIGYIVCPPQSS